jgi:hypothetical protein
MLLLRNEDSRTGTRHSHGKEQDMIITERTR